jgi:centromeric protein E
MYQSEYERERIAFELQEEKRAHAEREQRQAQKIENLSTLVLNSTIDERDLGKRTKKVRI